MAENNAEPHRARMTDEQIERAERAARHKAATERMIRMNAYSQPDIDAMVRPEYDITDFTEKFSKTKILKDTVPTRRVGNKVQCDIIVQDGDDVEETAMRAIFHGIMTTRDMHQFCAHICSLFMLMSPTLTKYVDTALLNLGIEKVEFKLPEEYNALTSGEELPEVQWDMAQIVWGLAVICLFKNSTPANHDDYMRARLRALFAHAHHHHDGEQIPIIWDVKKSTFIRTGLGTQRDFLRAVLSFVMDCLAENGPLTSVCEYIARILSWSEMSPLKFILDTLVKTRSPVLMDSRVHTEVHNLTDAFHLICSSPFPQFYRYFADSQDVSKLDRSRFPTLVAVASIIKQETDSRSVQHFNMGKQTERDIPVIVDLSKVHRDHIGSERRIKRNIDAAWLYDYDKNKGKKRLKDLDYAADLEDVSPGVN